MKKCKKDLVVQEIAYKHSPYDLKLRGALIDHLHYLLANAAEGWIPLGQDQEGRYPWERIGIKREVFESVIADFAYGELITIEIEPIHGPIARRVEHAHTATSEAAPKQGLDNGADT